MKRNAKLIAVLSIMLLGMMGNAYAQYVVPGNVVEWEWPPTGPLEPWEWELPSTVSGRALTLDDAPISNIEVTVTLPGGTELTTTTGDNGYYCISLPEWFEYGNVHIYFDGGWVFYSTQINLYYSGTSLTWDGYLERKW